MSVPLALSACGGRSSAPWIGPGGRALPRSLLSTARGGRHCNETRVTFLSLRPRLLNLRVRQAELLGRVTLLYARDPDGVLPATEVTAPYEAHTSLPPTAKDTGFHQRDLHLWIVPAQIGEAVYLVRGQNVERWPRVLGGCM